VLLRISLAKLLGFHTLALLLITLFQPAYSAEEEGTFGLTNFAFSHYLGTGFYSASGLEVFVIQLPFEHTIKEKTDNSGGWVLNLPFTIGLVNFKNLDLQNLPNIDDVATLSFIPGIEYQHPMTAEWTISYFADYGFARDFNQTSNVLVTGIGVKSKADFILNDSILTLGNSFLYAHEKSTDANASSDYSLLKTGLNHRFASDYINLPSVFTNLYYINYYYPDSLVFFDRAPNPIKIGNANEIGATFSNLPGLLFFEDFEIGFGIRFSDDIKVYRVVFGAPF